MRDCRHGFVGGRPPALGWTFPGEWRESLHLLTSTGEVLGAGWNVDAGRHNCWEKCGLGLPRYAGSARWSGKCMDGGSFPGCVAKPSKCVIVICLMSCALVMGSNTKNAKCWRGTGKVVWHHGHNGHTASTIHGHGTWSAGTTAANWNVDADGVPSGLW